MKHSKTYKVSKTKEPWRTNLGKPGETKSNPVKPSKYRGVPTNEFGCVIKREAGPRAGERWEAHYPLNTKKRVKTAKVRYETFKDKPGEGITTECVHEGKLKRNICGAHRKFGMTDQEWFKENC